MRKELEHWILGGWEAHTSLVPLMGSGVEGAAVGCIESGRRNKKKGGGPMGTVMQREDITEPLETDLED